MNAEPHANGNGTSGDAPDPPTDALGHFWKAAHEMLLAARVVIDAADALVEEQMQSRSEPTTPASRVRRIDVDDH